MNFDNIISNFIELKKSTKSKEGKWKQKQEYSQILFEEMFSFKLNFRIDMEGTAPSQCKRNCYDSYYGGITEDFIRQYGDFIDEKAYKNRKQHLVEKEMTELKSKSINFKYQIK